MRVDEVIEVVVAAGVGVVAVGAETKRCQIGGMSRRRAKIMIDTPDSCGGFVGGFGAWPGASGYFMGACHVTLLLSNQLSIT